MSVWEMINKEDFKRRQCLRLLHSLGVPGDAQLEGTFGDFHIYYNIHYYKLWTLLMRLTLRNVAKIALILTGVWT